MNESLDLKKILEIIIEELEELKARISRIENRENVILEETHLPEEENAIHRKILLSSDSGQVKKVVTYPTCEICGHLLSTTLIICQICKRKICPNCSVRYNGKIFCINCLRDMIPLEKKDFKLLLLLTNKIRRIQDITEFSGMAKEDVLNSLRKLKAYKLVLKRGFSIFSEIIPSENGLSVLASYSKIYGNEKDVVELTRRINLMKLGDEDDQKRAN